MAEEEVYGQPCADAKVVLLGATSVGKSALAMKYVRNEFTENQLTTVGACFFAKRIVVGSNVVKLQIWDTAGQERFHALTPLYYHGSVGAILVFDLANPASFKGVETWADELSQNTNEEIVLAVVGSKSDLYYAQPPDQRQAHVPKAAMAYAQQIGAMYMETSAKTGKGIDELFNELTKRIIERGLIKIPEAPAPGGDGSLPKSEPAPIRLEDSVPEESQGKRCKC